MNIFIYFLCGNREMYYQTDSYLQKAGESNQTIIVVI